MGVAIFFYTKRNSRLFHNTWHILHLTFHIPNSNTWFRCPNLSDQAVYVLTKHTRDKLQKQMSGFSWLKHRETLPGHFFFHQVKFGKDYDFMYKTKIKVILLCTFCFSNNRYLKVYCIRMTLSFPLIFTEREASGVPPSRYAHIKQAQNGLLESHKCLLYLFICL